MTASAVAVAAAALFQQRGREMAEARRVVGEFAFFGLHWAQAQPEEERDGRESWGRKFVVADVAKWLGRAHEAGGNMGVKSSDSRAR